ncbi:transposase domain-containing protein [Escherichia coli]
MFAGSDSSGGEHAGGVVSLIGACRLNNVEPEKWLRYVIERVGTSRQTGYAICCPGKFVELSVNINTVLTSRLPAFSYRRFSNRKNRLASSRVIGR